MGNGAQSWVLMALTDATEFTPGAAYSIYLGTSVLDFSDDPEHAVQQPPPLGGPITIQGSPIASGKLMTDSGTPTVDGYTLNLSGAKAVYFLAAVDSSESLSWAQGTWQGTIESMFLDETTAKQQFSGETWTEVYAHIESMLGSINKFKGGDGTFSICSEDSGGFGGVSEVSGWTLMVLTDATEVAPGAAYSIYYGTSDLKGGAITIQGSPIASGNLKTDTPVSADPSVTIDKVATVEPWDSMKGEITVDYSLGGIDSKYEYKVAFDVTAGGKTASITNAAAKLTAGKQPQQTINTVELFGKETVDKEAKLKISLIVVKPKESAPVQGGVQLWANGPFWAESNLGSADDVTPPEYGLLYTHDAAVNALPSGWRLPTKDELAALLDESKCSKQQTSQNGVEGCLFTSKSDSSKSVFMPYGGTGGNNGTTRKYCTMVGVYWSSTFDTPETPWTLGISSSENHMGNADLVSSGHLVRPVRDAE